MVQVVMYQYFLQGGDKEFSETIFEQRYDSDGLRVEYFNEEHKMEWCENIIVSKWGGGVHYANYQ